MSAGLSDRRGLADYVLCVLGSLYTRIIDDWELSDMRNPTAGIKRFGSRRVERFLSLEERRAVNDVLDRRQNAQPPGDPRERRKLGAGTATVDDGMAGRSDRA